MHTKISIFLPIFRRVQSETSLVPVPTPPLPPVLQLPPAHLHQLDESCDGSRIRIQLDPRQRIPPHWRVLSQLAKWPGIWNHSLANISAESISRSRDPWLVWQSFFFGLPACYSCVQWAALMRKMVFWTLLHAVICVHTLPFNAFKLPQKYRNVSTP